jgi:hypothetical protein
MWLWKGEERTGDGIRLTYNIRCVKSHDILEKDFMSERYQLSKRKVIASVDNYSANTTFSVTRSASFLGFFHFFSGILCRVPGGD